MALRPVVGGVLLAALLVALLLAGCAGSPSKAPNGDVPSAVSGPVAATAGLALPTWAVGDYWTYTFNGQPTTYGITSQTGSDWIMDTDSDERAWSDARDDVSRLGPQRKSDLAGSQGDERVEFFRWPLTDNLTWSTRWDHADVKITAHVADGVANLQAHSSNGTLVYRYTYDPKVGWFRELHHLGPDGKEVVGLALSASGHAWTAKGVRYMSKVLYSMAGSGTNGQDAKTLQPEASATDLWLTYHFTCNGGNGGLSIDLVPADASVAGQDKGHTVSGGCTQQDWDQAVPGPVTAQWALAYAVGAQSVSYSVEVLQRTRTEVAVA